MEEYRWIYYFTAAVCCGVVMGGAPPRSSWEVPGAAPKSGGWAIALALKFL
jgi:hypothetical protein